MRPAIPLPICRVDAVRAIENTVLGGASPPDLMERAGAAAAQFAIAHLLAGKRSVLVVAGPGNNGGDGFVVARHLLQAWHRVQVVFTGDATRLSGDARKAYDAWLATGQGVRLEAPREPIDLVVDALFGIGLTRDVEGRHAALIEWTNRQRAPVLALDVPSGLEADCGRVLGCAVRARHTATFIALKPGLLTLDGPDHAGDVHLFDLGLDVASMHADRGWVIGEDAVATALAPRARNTHKGSFGSLGVIGGAAGMTGAALLAGRAALHLGTGRTYVGLLDARGFQVDTSAPELMLRECEDTLALAHLNALVVGPGLGQTPPARSAVARALERNVPLVLDADALNLIGAHEALADVCRARVDGTLMTPHPAEAARLLRTTVAEVQKDRVGSAQALAQHYRACVALKGVGTVIATPDGPWYINTSGNPGLASAGMGDVLCGILGALLAQGVTAERALCAGVHLHGLAADACAHALGGEIGLTASEIAQSARRLLNAAVYGTRPD